MQNRVNVFLVALSVAALFSFLIPDGGTSLQRKANSYDEAALAELSNAPLEILQASGGVDPGGRGRPWLLAAKEDDDGDGQAGDAEKEEEDDKGGGNPGFDRHWDVTCCA